MVDLTWVDDVIQENIVIWPPIIESLNTNDAVSAIITDMTVPKVHISIGARHWCF